MRGLKPRYSDAVEVTSATGQKILDAPIGSNPFTYLYVVNKDQDNDCELMFGDEEKFYIPKGFIGGLPGLVCNAEIKAKKLNGNVDSLYVTAW